MRFLTLMYAALALSVSAGAYTNHLYIPGVVVGILSSTGIASALYYVGNPSPKA